LSTDTPGDGGTAPSGSGPRRALEVVTRLREIREELRQHIRFVAVLFADLCDSTSYKLNRGDVDGLLKTYAHNSIVDAAITKHRGTIIKYIGDEVMATFEGDSAIANAVNAATEIQQAMIVYNSKITDLPRDEHIESKIGIHAGNVIMVQFPGHEAEDPQGKIVDATARIISLSNPGQILCSDVIQSTLSQTHSFSTPSEREAKGIKNGVKIFEVIYDSKMPRAPKTVRHADNKTDDVLKILYHAVHDELSGNVPNAFRGYDHILRIDPLHFAANYRKARLSYRGYENLSQPVKLSDVKELAKKAEESHPDSGLAMSFSVITEWADVRQGKKTGADEPSFEMEQLDVWIKKLRSAVQHARTECDIYGEVAGLNALVWFLTSQFEISGDVTKFNEAVTICEMLENIINDFEQHSQAGFFETYARLLSRRLDNRAIFDKARSLIERSLKYYESEFGFLTKARLIGEGRRRGWV
jgi:class 3 adenylate cyclase